MDHRFFIEAKSFCLSAKDGCPKFRLEEKRKEFTGVIFVSLTAASMLVDSLEEACLPVKEDFSKAFQEDGSALMVHAGGGGGNKAGRFLQVGIFVEGSHKGVIWILEGRNGCGWQQFASELRLLISSKVKGLDLEAPPLAGLFTRRSFVEVIREVLGI
jgi:hypothetical protein